MAAKRRPTGVKTKGIKTKGWGKYSPEQSARAAHLRTNPGDVYWSTAPRKSTVRLDMPPGWTFVERICNGPNGTCRKYKVYLGPNGEQAPSIPQAWAKHEAGGGKPPKQLTPQVAPLPPGATDMERRRHAAATHATNAAVNAAAGVHVSRSSSPTLMLRTQPRKPPHPQEALYPWPVKVPPSSYGVFEPVWASRCAPSYGGE